MVRSLWESLRSIVTRSSESDSEARRFLPSPLDRSVRAAHGGSDEEAARELEQLDEQARELKAQQRDP